MTGAAVGKTEGRRSTEAGYKKRVEYARERRERQGGRTAPGEEREVESEKGIL